MKAKLRVTLAVVRVSRARRVRTLRETLEQRDARQRMVIENLGLVERNATSVVRHMRPNFEREELKAIGNLELVKRAQSFDPRKAGNEPRRQSTAFAGYARKGVRGAMWELARRKNWREASHESLESRVEFKHGDDTERNQIQIPDPAEGPLELLETAQRAAQAVEALDCLNARERYVVERFYAEDGDLGEIGRRLGIGASCASRIHRAALVKMREHFALRGRLAA